MSQHVTDISNQGGWERKRGWPSGSAFCSRNGGALLGVKVDHLDDNLSIIAPPELPPPAAAAAETPTEHNNDEWNEPPAQFADPLQYPHLLLMMNLTMKQWLPFNTE